MKIELKRVTKIDGSITHFIYAGERILECFSIYEKAKEYFDNVKSAEEKIETLETKEV